MDVPQSVALCFGEILWDFLPEGLFMGGAPANVGCHLRRLGQAVHPVTAVGQDVLGEELLRRLEHEHIDLAGIARLDSYATGYGQASFGQGTEASYRFAPDVAWDHIPLNDATKPVAEKAAALIFGSLAQRSAANRATLEKLLLLLPAEAWRIFDVNLRPPHDDLDLVRQLTHRATLVKLNHHEAARLAGETPGASGREEIHARALARDSHCRTICVTAGEHGAGLLYRDRWFWEAGRPVQVVDTVGAGDSFLASLVASLLRGETPGQAMLARACRLGEWVAAHRGATPTYDTTTPR
jgi:fructokinase